MLQQFTSIKYMYTDMLNISKITNLFYFIISQTNTGETYLILGICGSTNETFTTSLVAATHEVKGHYERK